MSTGRPLVVFADSASTESVALLAASLRRASKRSDLEVVAVCDARLKRPEPHVLAAGRALGVPVAMRLFDPERHVVLRRTMVRSLRGLARNARVKVLVPPGQNVNHPDFGARLRAEFGASLGLSLLIPQIFGRPLLGALERAVNFHPGRLPAYRGLAPTAWEVYRGEPHAGLSFHLMTAGIDEGPVVVEGAIPVSPRLTVEELEWLKLDCADALLDEVFDALVGSSPGRPQAGGERYFGRAELRAIQAVDDPSTLAWPELQLRLRAFGALMIRLAGERYTVTRLRRLDDGAARSARHAFTTLDGVRVQATRFRYLPLSVARLLGREYRPGARASRG